MIYKLITTDEIIPFGNNILQNLYVSSPDHDSS